MGTETKRATNLLRFFGVDLKKVLTSKKRRIGMPKRTLWSAADSYELQDMFHLAHGKYIAMIVAAHPDLPGGSEELSKRINRAWSDLKDLFVRKGVGCP